MATGTLSNSYSDGKFKAFDFQSVAWNILNTLGSLKITVWGFFLAIVLLLVGTLAQDEETIPDVKRDYFNSWVAQVPLDVFLPVTIFPLDERTRIPYVVPFPGGATIGLILLINLIAAKLTRFKMTATGAKLIAGLAFCLVGATITAVVILGAHAEDGLQGEPPFSYETLWQITKGSIFVTTLACIAYLIAGNLKSKLGFWSLVSGTILMVAWSLLLILMPETFRVPDPGLRIVWQMSKSLIAGTILLVGFILLFGRRGGNVLIHLSIGMMMLGQFIFGDRQIEERISLADGESTNMAIRPDEIELALINRSDPTKDSVVAINQDKLIAASGSQKAIDDPALPVQIIVDEYIENAQLAKADDTSVSLPKNRATAGLGSQYIAIPAVKTGGAMDKMNTPAAYIKLLSKDGKETLGTYLVALQANDRSSLTLGQSSDIPEELAVDAKPYEMALRYRRTYKDYRVTLKDVERINYSGSDTVRDFSSFVTFVDKEGKEKIDGRIWMNNPMRYRGETFYQSSFSPKELVGKDTTGLQVVSNAGWLVPYISCAFAALGMLAHFGSTFVRFASRFERESTSGTSKNPEPMALAAGINNSSRIGPASPEASAYGSGKKPISSGQATPLGSPNWWESARQARRGIGGWLLPLAVVTIVGGMFVSAAMEPKSSPDSIDWYAAGNLPMQHEGRIKPVDSVARNLLQALSGQTSVVVNADNDGNPSAERTLKATEWFYGLISDQPWIDHAYMFRIDAKEVLDVFDLDTEDSKAYVSGFMKVVGKEGRNRYSWAQLRPKMDNFIEKMQPILEKRRTNPESLKFQDQKFMELYQKINLFQMTSLSYSTNRLPAPPKSDDDADRRRFGQELIAEMRAVQQLEDGKPASIIPPLASSASNSKASDRPADDPSTQWRALRPALFASYAAKAMGMDDGDNKMMLQFLDLRDAVRDGKPLTINQEVEKYAKLLGEQPNLKAILPAASFEGWYNKFGPISGCIAFYLMAFVLTLFSMIMFPQPLRRTAFWMTVVVFVVHVVAIAARVYITGKAPVINLYSSAVFIGCGAVLFGLVLEILYPIRIGLLAGTAIGSTSLLVAYGLDSSDTMHVLQAVLDTQFWLTTHVQCITAGYLATFFAGFLAIGAIVHRSIHARTLLSDSPKPEAVEMQRVLMRMTYGTICFATFFSLIGTVLGGLWADDSWGRFWGWDPKENGALMIVIWNAILLHARWDKLVRERGFALLAIGGNIITAWSWFGTNQLGIGLHSYGFTSGVLMILTWFVFSQMLIIIVGGILTAPWLYGRSSKPNDFDSLGRPVGSWE